MAEMKIDELIKILERAQELGDFQEEWSHGDFDIHAGKWKRASYQFRGEAEASTIRHNMAGSVLRYLRDVHWTNCANHEYGESVKRLAEMVKTERARAEKAEAEVERRKNEPFPWSEFLDCRARLIVHFRSEGKSWDEVVGLLSCEPIQVQRLD